MSPEHKDIFAKIQELKDRLADYRAEMTMFGKACQELARQRDAAIQRAETAETQLAEANARADIWEHNYAIAAPRESSKEMEAKSK